MRLRAFAAMGLLVGVLAVAWVQAAAPTLQPPGFRISPGVDHDAAREAGVVTHFEVAPRGTSFSVGLSTFVGATVVVDSVARVDAPGAVVWLVPGQRAPAGVEVLQLRLWHGSVAPAQDAAPGVCGGADLVAGTAWGSCRGGRIDVQMVYAPGGSRAHGADGAATFRFAASH